MRIGLDISVLVSNQKTGVGVYTYELIKHVLKNNREDQFILFGISPLAAYRNLNNIEFKDYPNVTVKIYRIPARLFRVVFLIWQKLNWPNIEKLIGDVDAFHGFNWFFPPQNKGKKIATIFDLTSLKYPHWHHPRTHQLDKVRFERIKREATLVVAISENSKKDYLKFDPGGNVEVVYPAVTARQKNENVLTKHGLQPGYILSVSTLEPRKNLLRLIKGYLKSGVKNPLVLVGMKGWKEGPIFNLTSKYPHKIKLLGFIPDGDLPEIYSAASCLVYPSLYEGFGIPVLEAMSYKTPVITSANSSLHEVGGDAVYYINPLKVEEIAAAIKKVISDKTVAKDLSEKGVKQAKKFNWDNSARKMIKLYHS